MKINLTAKPCSTSGRQALSQDDPCLHQTKQELKKDKALS
jgi:hypothetical protein